MSELLGAFAPDVNGQAVLITSMAVQFRDDPAQPEAMRQAAVDELGPCRARSVVRLIDRAEALASNPVLLDELADGLGVMTVEETGRTARRILEELRAEETPEGK